MKIAVAALALLMVLPIGAVASEVATLRTTLSCLNLKDPASDARRNFAHGDLRFVGVRDYSCNAPGREGRELESLIATHGLRCLDGTTDALEGPEHSTLQRHASTYGIEYNKELASLIQRGPNQSFEPTPSARLNSRR